MTFQLKTVQLMRTQRCSNPECDEVIYRDTLDKDDAYVLDSVPGKFFHSQSCAATVLYSDRLLRELGVFDND